MAFNDNDDITGEQKLPSWSSHHENGRTQSIGARRSMQ